MNFGKLFSLLFFGLGVVFLLSGCQEKTESISIDLSQEILEDEVNVSSSVDIAKPQQNNDQQNHSSSSDNLNNSQDDTQTVTAQIPQKLILPVLFAQQAPFGDWNEINQETCEEASIIMADRYFKKMPLDESIMKEEIAKLLDWQQSHNYKIDLTAQETVQVLQDYYGLKAKLSRQVSTERIKFELFRGNLIIVPTAGRELKNPNFKQPGPIYHMLVIKGYNQDNFITNDPGTRKGDSFKYPYQRLLDAIHDWNHQLAEEGMTEAEMSNGEQIMIIVGDN